MRLKRSIEIPLPSIMSSPISEQLLLTEIYKIVHNLSPTFMTQVFEEKNVSYNFRENNSLALPKAKTALDGIDTIRYIEKNYGRRKGR